MAKKILVTCFSASGVTKRVGKEIARIAGGDFFEIVPKEIYTSDDLNWMNKRSRSTLEMNDSASRPEIAGAVADMDSYDMVIVGSPIWWGIAPRIIETFLESYDMSGKVIAPFCTSGGSGVDSIYYHDRFSLATGDIALSAAFLFVGAVIMVVGRNNVYAFLIGTLIAVFGNLGALFWKYKKRGRKL